MKAFILRAIFWISDFFKGSPIRKEYQQIQHVMAKKQNTNKELDNLLTYATTNCPFYTVYAGKSLSAFPVVNKQIIKENMDYIRVPEEKNPWQKKDQQYHIQKTSGSTGVPFSIPHDSRKRNHRIAELKYFGKLAGFYSHDCLIQLRIWNRWQKKSKLQEIKENIIAFDCSNLNNESLANLCSIIKSKKARCLRGMASSFTLLAQYLIKNNIYLSEVRVIFSGGEALQESTRDALSKYCPNGNIISQYANEEAGVLGQEAGKSQRYFILNNASYIFEVLKEHSNEPAAQGELGRIVITDLFNYACPLIRYDTGDMGIISFDSQHSPCSIDQLFGRLVDIVYSTKGEPISPSFISRMLKNYDDISTWQFIQNQKNKYTLKLSLRKETTRNAFEKHEQIIKQDILTILGQDALIDIMYVKDIPVLSSGKRKPIINELNR